MNSLKRPHSPACSDDEDDFSEDLCTVTGSSEHVGGSTRKRRRGVIEKRRRDRINNSLNELKRLVPTALEKSGSAKLEKAEILQMTVDHLKVLHAKGYTDANYDPHRFAMEYHGIGFRECAAEVARYLVTVEGMDVQDPMRLRLMSHLQMFAAGSRAPVNNQPPMGYSYTPPACAYASFPHADGRHTSSSPHMDNRHVSPDASIDPLTGYFTNSTLANNMSRPSSTTVATPTSSNGHYSMASPSMSGNGGFNVHAQFSFSHAPAGQGSNYASSASLQNKPYRPWGAEMAC